MGWNRIFLLCFFGFNGTVVSCQEASLNPSTVEKIKEVENGLTGWVEIEGLAKWTIPERMKHYNVKGISIAVIRDYKLDWTKSYGFANEPEKIPVTESTVFQAGSISKSLNGVGLLTLVQDKKIDLYSDINTYLRTWKFPYDSVAKQKKISVANLLSHTAGLSVHGFPGYSIDDSIPTLMEILDGKRPANTQPVRSLFEPGLKYKYSGGGTTISQVVLMDVTGRKYDEYMWDHVLKPLGILNSTYTQPSKSQNNPAYACGYYEDGKEVKGKYHVYPEQAAAGLWTNPRDLSKYIIETQLSLAGKSGKVLSKEMTELRLTPHIDSSAALGVFISKKGNRKYFSHNGQDEGFTAAYMASFDGDGVIVMSNSDNSALNGEIVNSVAAVYKWEGMIPQRRKTVQVPDTVLAKFIGNYRIDKDTVIVNRKGDHLVVGIKGTPIEWKVYFTGPQAFIIPEVKGEFSIARENGSKVQSLALKQDSNILYLNRMQ